MQKHWSLCTATDNFLCYLRIVAHELASANMNLICNRRHACWAPTAHLTAYAEWMAEKRTNEKRKKILTETFNVNDNIFYHELLCSRNFVWCNVVRYVNVRIEFSDTDFEVEGNKKKECAQQKQCRLSVTETAYCICNLAAEKAKQRTKEKSISPESAVGYAWTETIWSVTFSAKSHFSYVIGGFESAIAL